VKFLVDESLSSTVSRLLSEAGHDALHVGDLDLLGASDDAVMAAADTTGSVLVSTDTDFGELLALGGQPGPSVVIFRRAPHRPGRQAQLLLRALPDIENELTRGAVVILTSEVIRVRHLRIDRTGP
jgi:predicted nuclease of predicted toxin-antitoxin system